MVPILLGLVSETEEAADPNQEGVDLDSEEVAMGREGKAVDSTVAVVVDSDSVELDLHQEGTVAFPRHRSVGFLLVSLGPTHPSCL